MSRVEEARISWFTLLVGARVTGGAAAEERPEKERMHIKHL